MERSEIEKENLPNNETDNFENEATKLSDPKTESQPTELTDKTDHPINETAETENTSTDIPTKPEEEQQGFSFITKLIFFFLAYIVTNFVITYYSPQKSYGNLLHENESFTVNFFVARPGLTNASLRKMTPASSVQVIYRDDYQNNLLEDAVAIPITHDSSLLSASKVTIDNHLFLYASFKSNRSELNTAFNKHLIFFPLYEKNESLLDNMTKREVEMDETAHRQRKSNIIFKKELTLWLLTPSTTTINVKVASELKQLGAKMVDSETEYTAVDLNDFWCSHKDEEEITSESKESAVTVKVRFIGGMLFSMMKAVEMNSRKFRELGIPDTKGLLVELLKYNETYYLVILFTVNILHSLFTCLELVEDVRYHNKLKKLDGINSKEALFALAFQVSASVYYRFESINFYYQILNYVSIAMSLWKLRKIYSVIFSSVFPFVHLENKIPYVDSESKRYENEAISLFSKWLFLPLSLGYFGYCYYYYFDKISFVHFIFKFVFYLFVVFGFILMTPQIYINYKLKSVENMPKLLFVYKFLDTIIDDLMVFALETPILKKISVFRDDIIFGILIVQMFIYKKKEEEKEKTD